MGCGGYDVLCCKLLFFSPTFALVTLASVQLAGSCDSATVEASSLVQDGTWVEPIPSKLRQVMLQGMPSNMTNI